MPDSATGGPIEGPIEFEPGPCTFYAPGFAPTIPGGDWFIEGRRFSELSRTVFDGGKRQRIILGRAEES